MFWSDWGRWPRIERASLDGTNRTTIISTKIFWPNGLAIDLIKERIYFADAHLDYIESCDYNGQRRTQILGNDLFLHHPHSLSLFEDEIFWIDRGHTSLSQFNRMTGNKTILTGTSQNALTVKVAHELLQPNDENPCTRANCEHLCLQSASNPFGYSCECQIGYIKDTQNPNRCNLDRTEFLLILKRTTIGGLSIFANDTSQIEDTIANPSEIADEPTDIPPSSIDKDLLWERLIPVTNIRNGFDFTYDFTNQIIYFLQHNATTAALNIESVEFSGANRAPFTTNDAHLAFTPFCLDFDPSSGNLIVANTLNSLLEVYNTRTRHRAVVFGGNDRETGVGFPTALTVNYQDSEIYWIDHGMEAVPKKIGSVRMDGSNERILVQNDINDIVALFYHFRGKRVYWVDAGKNRIESILATGSDRQTVVSDVEHPTALAIWDAVDSAAPFSEPVSILYYVDVAFEQLIALNLRTQEKRILRANLADVLQMKIYQAPKLNANNPCLLNNGGCHHICIPSPGNSFARVCRCASGLQLSADGVSCQLFNNFLVYSSQTSVNGLRIPVDNQSLHDPMPHITGTRISKLDFDYKSRSIIWIEDDTSINLVQFSPSWSSATSSNMDFFKIRTLFELNSANGVLMGLSVDWVNNNLYYSFYENQISYIKVAKMPTAELHLTIASAKVDKITELAVNPRLRFLYWVDQGQQPRIERAYLNGENRTVLVSSDIASPTDIFVDVSTGFVYWCDDMRDRIERMDFDGRNRRVLKSSNLPSPKGVAVFEGILYYVDSRLRAIYALNLTNLNETTLLRKIRSERFVDVAIYDERAQPGAIETPCGGSCEQMCFALPQNPMAKCACALGELAEDARSCRKPKEYLIYALETEIRGLGLFNSEQVPWKPITGLKRAIGVDFDYVDAKVFFSDIEEKKVAWFSSVEERPRVVDLVRLANGSTPVSARNISQPDGIAFDWTADTIYWSDKQLKQIVSVNINTGLRHVVAYSDAPRAVVVHPCKGLLFWTDIGREPMIARSSLAGSGFRKIVTSDIKWPNGLSIDYDDDKLYWADAYLDKIERCDFEGNNRQVLSTALHPFALTVHHHFVYWSDWSTNAIYRAEKYRGSNTVALVQGLPSRPMDVQVWSEQRQRCQYNPCGVFNGGCSHLCSVAPPGNRTECRCPAGLRLKLANNDRTCVPLNAQRCNATQFTCANGNCIGKRFVCDGVRHCTDGSDESPNFCSQHRCLPSEFQCRNGRCIPMPERCDRNNQCDDNR